MDSGADRFPTVRAYLPLIVILLVMGWGGLFLLMNFTQPTLWPRWLFFFLIVLGVTGIVMPAVVYVYQRFPSAQAPEQNVIVRQSLWGGIFVAVMIWISLGQVFNLTLAMFGIVGIVVIEVFLRLRERAFWRRP